MYTCVYIHIYTCMCIYIYVCVCVYIHTYTCIHTHICIHVHGHVHAHVNAHSLEYYSMVLYSKLNTCLKHFDCLKVNVLDSTPHDQVQLCFHGKCPGCAKYSPRGRTSHRQQKSNYELFNRNTIKCILIQRAVCNDHGNEVSKPGVRSMLKQIRNTGRTSVNRSTDTTLSTYNTWIR